MGNIQITNITPAVSTPAQTDALACEQSSVTKKITSAQIAEANMSTNAEALTGTSTTKHTSPANVKYVLDNTPASATAKGIIEIATDAETLTGTDTERATTPANVKYVLDIKNGYYASPSAVDHGVDNNDLSIKDLINTIGSAERTIICQPGTYTITTALTIPANITLKVLSGAVLTKGGSATLTINGKIEAGLYQIFSGWSSGNVTFSGIFQEVLPEWWNIDGTADEVEINMAIVAIGDYGTVKLSAPTYTTAAEIVISKTGSDVLGVNLIGSGVGTTIITSTSTGNILRIGNDGGTYGVQRSTIQGFAIISETANTGIYFTGGGAGRNMVRDLRIRGKTIPLANSTGILMWGALVGNFYNTFDNVEVENWNVNISMGYNWNTAATTATPSNATRFHKMKIHDWSKYGFYNKNTVETYLQGNFEHAVTGALADIYLAAAGGDGMYNTINESGVGNAYILENLCGTNIIQVYYKPADTPIVDNNTIERNIWIFNGGTFKTNDFYVGSIRKALGYGIKFEDTINLQAGAFINIDKTITAPGTTGNQTINKMLGRVNIAPGGTTVTVTSSAVTANSIIFAIPATADATARVTSVVASAGSFVINTVAVTAETAFNFLVMN